MEVLAGKDLPSTQYVINKNLQAKYDQQIHDVHILLHFSTVWVGTFHILTDVKNMQNRRMRVLISLLKLRNKTMRIYFLLAIRPEKSRGINYAKCNNTNKINQVKQTLSCFPKFLEKIMLKLVLKHFKKLTKNYDPFCLKNAQLKILNWINLHSFSWHFLRHFFIASSEFRIELQNFLQSSLQEGIPEKMDWKLGLQSWTKYPQTF